MTKYWISTVSREHVLKGVKGGFCQLCHGKDGPLKRLHAGDWLIYYSSKEKFGEPEPCQKFTAIGEIVDDEIYPFDMGGGFVPYRRKVHYHPCHEVSILPLIEKFDFIPDKKRWGGPFRFGLVRIEKKDFDLIKNQMLK